MIQFARLIFFTIVFPFTTTAAFALPTLSQQIDPPEANVGDDVTVTLTVQNGTIANVQLPTVDGLEVQGTSSSTNMIFANGTLSTSVSEIFTLVPSRSGNFIIPAFDIHTQDGTVLHVRAMKLHVYESGSPSGNNAVAPATPSTSPPANSNGPVVMPPANPIPGSAPPDNGNPAASSGSSIDVPRDKDGNPAKVFLLITPQTTDAYVGQSVPLQIDFYIRMDVNSEQNSLPTIKGSDFLMNNSTHFGQRSLGILDGQQYLKESWSTALSAPKSGDFPLSMERDSYWVKSFVNNAFDPFGGFFGRRANLAHEQISSNLVTMHIHPLPTVGQPAHFTGAIGHFNVSAQAQPASVQVGEPVTLRFAVTGDGNFDYVRCPYLADNPAWKTYPSKNSTNYLDESETHAVKTFEQSVIPRKNGTVPLPAASFSYFNPDTKQYVTIPVALPDITVNGSAAPLASVTGGDSDSGEISNAPGNAALLPNRLDLGSPRVSLAPVYRQPWFWPVQVGLLCLPLLGALSLLFRPRSGSPDDRAERALRRRSLQQEEDAMSLAVRSGDALAFFTAARHSIQLQLGTQWNLRPEAITLGEILDRDPQLAETLEPLFTQADEVIYSGHAPTNLDLAHWEQTVRELLQPQPA